MSGIIPAVLTRSGIWVLPPAYILMPRTRLPYCTGIRRSPSCTTTITNMVMAVITRKIPTINTPIPTPPPSLAWACVQMRTRFWGTRATIPLKMINDSPLPMPCSVINSPSQMANIVPAVIATNTETVGRIFSGGLKPNRGKIGAPPLPALKTRA